MLLAHHQVSELRRLFQLILIFLLISLFFIDALFLTSHTSPTPTPFLEPFGSTHGKTFFIASIHRNTSPPRVAAWSDSLLRLVSFLGPRNVYVSAVDRGSEDGTGFELLMLKDLLDERRVANAFDLGTLPWYRHAGPNDGDDPAESDNMTVVKARNMALEPLRELAKEGITFDFVLWIEEGVAFRPQDITALLNTHNGDFAAACTMPVSDSPDILALRDNQRHRPASTSWPWFYSPTSRSATLKWSSIPVFSCWGGIVAFDATPFYAEPVLQFRTVDDTLSKHHLEADERCLFHADNFLAAEKGIWINPNIQVVPADDQSSEENAGSFAMYAAV